MIINGQAYDVEQAMISPEPADGVGAFAAPRNAGVHRGKVYSDDIYGTGAILRNGESSGFVFLDGVVPCTAMVLESYSEFSGGEPTVVRLTALLASYMGSIYIKESTTITCEVTYRLLSDGSAVGSDTADLIVTGGIWWGPVAVSPDEPDAMDFLGEDYFERSLGHIIFGAPAGQYVSDVVFNIVP